MQSHIKSERITQCPWDMPCQSVSGPLVLVFPPYVLPHLYPLTEMHFSFQDLAHPSLSYKVLHNNPVAMDTLPALKFSVHIVYVLNY